MSYYAATCLVVAHRSGVAFPKLQTFSEIIWARLWSIRISDTRNFCLFVYLQSYNDKCKFSFLETMQLSRNRKILV